MCCKRCVSVLCCSTGCVRVLAKLAVAVVDKPGRLIDAEESVEMDEPEVRECILCAASAFSKSRCRSSLLRADHVLVASISALSRSRSTISMSVVAGEFVEDLKKASGPIVRTQRGRELIFKARSALVVR